MIEKNQTLLEYVQFVTELIFLQIIIQNHRFTNNINRLRLFQDRLTVRFQVLLQAL